MNVDVVTYDADPNHGGFGARVHGLVRMLASFARVRVFLTDWFEAPPVTGVEYVRFPVRDTAWTRLRRLRTFYKTDFEAPAPVDGADAVIVETLDRWGLAADGGRVPRILDEHNVYWDLWTYDMDGAPFFSTWLGRRAAVRRALEPRLWRRAKAYEVRALREANRALVTSEADRSRILAELPDIADRVHVVPNTVDVERFPDRSGSATVPDVVFVGNYAYRPNMDAARFIVERLAPSLPSGRFVLAGGSPPPVPAAATNVHAPGFVKDLQDVLGPASVAIAPLQQGSGTRLKILTYLACGKAVVATSKAVEGLEVEDGVHLLIRDDETAFRDAVARLLEDAEERRVLGSRGRRLVRDRYDWRVYVDPLRTILETACDRGAVAGRQ